MMAKSIYQHGQCDGAYSWGAFSHKDMTVYGVPTLLLCDVISCFCYCLKERSFYFCLLSSFITVSVIGKIVTLTLSTKWQLLVTAASCTG